MRTETRVAIKTPAKKLSVKRNRTHSELCRFVCLLISVGMARALSYMARGTRDKTARADYVAWEDGRHLVGQLFKKD